MDMAIQTVIGLLMETRMDTAMDTVMGLLIDSDTGMEVLMEMMKVPLKGMMMAMLRLNVPSVFMYGGSILPGKFKGRDVTVVDVFEAVGQHAAERIAVAAGRERHDEADRFVGPFTLRVQRRAGQGDGRAGGTQAGEQGAAPADGRLCGAMRRVEMGARGGACRGA